jgi:hypothetical protein
MADRSKSGIDFERDPRAFAEHSRRVVARDVISERPMLFQAPAAAWSYVNPNTVSVSQRLNDSLSMNCLNSSVSSLSTAVMTRASALSCSIRAFCLSEFCRAFW